MNLFALAVLIAILFLSGCASSVRYAASPPVVKAPPVVHRPPAPSLPPPRQPAHQPDRQSQPTVIPSPPAPPPASSASAADTAVVDTLITEKKVRVKEVWHGNASYYALAFQGKRTASGERFDSYAFTAAHRTLPFGSMVRVTDMKSGSWVDVRVNDRGPFKHDRIIDISYAAAREIGLVRAGVLRVKVEELE